MSDVTSSLEYVVDSALSVLIFNPDSIRLIVHTLNFLSAFDNPVSELYLFVVHIID